MLNNYIDGISFFNGGQKAGSSQPRKHIQTLPYSSLSNKHFGLFEIIENEENLTENEDETEEETKLLMKSFNINNFTKYSIPHLVIKFSKEFTSMLNSASLENIELLSKIYREIYINALDKLNLYHDETEIKEDYSLIFSNEFLFIAPRKTDKVEVEGHYLNLNTASFFMSILIKDVNLLEYLKSINIIEEVYTKL